MKKEEKLNVVIENYILIALKEVVQQFNLPTSPFLELLIAFRSDQHFQRFQTLNELEGYSRFSANPVGHILLYLLLGKPTEQQLAYSDQICSALQWTNFWQDVQRDRKIGRNYIPLEIEEKYPVFVDQIKELTRLTRNKFEQGQPLLATLPRRFRFEISLFWEGGFAILKKLEKIHYQTDQMRPILSRWDKLIIMFRGLLRLLYNKK